MRKIMTIGLTLALGMGTWAGMAGASDTKSKQADRSDVQEQIQVRGRQTVWVRQDAKPAYALTGQPATRSATKSSDERSPSFDIKGRAGSHYQAR
jgi:hypothetical protein